MKIVVFKNLRQYTLTSALKKEEVELVKKYRPDALKKKDADGNDLFAISYVEGKSCLSANGITFGAVEEGTGCLMLVGAFPGDVPLDKCNEYIADITGSAIAPLLELEASVPAVITEIKAARNNIISNITTV